MDKDTLDNFVRDVTSVMPMSKSEVRRRLNDIIEFAKEQERRETLLTTIEFISHDMSFENEAQRLAIVEAYKEHFGLPNTFTNEPQTKNPTRTKVANTRRRKSA